MRVLHNLYGLIIKKQAAEGRIIGVSEVAEAVGKPLTTLLDWANGKTRSTPDDLLLALRRYFACSLDDLLVEMSDEDYEQEMRKLRPSRRQGGRDNLRNLAPLSKDEELC